MGGKFIVLEGGEGTGKSTQIKMLVEALKVKGITAVTSREPGGTPGGAKLRDLILGPEYDWPGPAELFLYLADRAVHVRTFIEPQLAEGFWIISDRYEESTLAYQIDGRGLDREEVERANRMASGGRSPDLTLILNMPEGAGLKRALSRGDANKFERAGEEFHQRVNAAYEKLAEAPHRRLLDASGTPEEVHGRIWAEVESLLS